MFQKALASFAGAAAGSVVTWMTMDNEMLKVKATHAAELKARDATHNEKIKALEPNSAEKAISIMAFGALTTGTITMLKALVR
jgi:hypothetical protein